MCTNSHPKVPPRWPAYRPANSYTCRDEHHPVPSPNVPPPYQWHPVCISPFAQQDSCPYWESFFNTFLVKSRELYPAPSVFVQLRRAFPACSVLFGSWIFTQTCLSTHLEMVIYGDPEVSRAGGSTSKSKWTWIQNSKEWTQLWV